MPSAKEMSLASLRSWSSSNLLGSSDWLQSNIGVLVAILSGMLLTLYSFVYKTIEHEISRGSVLVLRGVVQSILFTWLSYCGDVKSLSKEIFSSKLIILTLIVALMAGLRLCLIFTALQLLPMAVVHSILNGSPVLVMLLAHLTLKDDKCSPLKTVASGLFVIGMALVFQPHRVLLAIEDNRLVVGMLMSLLALFLSASGAVLTKVVSSAVDKLHLTALIGISIATVGLVASYVDLVDNDDNKDIVNATSFPVDPVVWAKAFVVAIVGASQQFCLIVAIGRDRPSRVTMARSSQVIFSFLLQLGALPNEKVDLDQMAGAALILAAIVCVALESDKKTKLAMDNEEKREESNGDKNNMDKASMKESNEDKAEMEKQTSMSKTFLTLQYENEESSTKARN